MKKLLLTLTSCSSGTEIGVFQIKSEEYDNKIKDLEDRMDKVEADLGQLFARDAFLESEMVVTQTAVRDNQILIEVIESILEDLEDELDNHGFRIAGLENNRKIRGVIRPCATAKELLLKFDNGLLLGYFENGNKRYLSELSNGNYTTTDGTGCNFNVSGSGTANLTVTEL